MARRTTQLLDDIAQAAAAIRVDIAGMSLDDFLLDGGIQRSVIYSLGTMGEAIRLLLVAYPDLPNLRPEVPWRQAVGFRNRVFHAYWDTQLDVVWETTSNLDALEQVVQELRHDDLD